jgi:hypothetical protein
MEIKTMNDPHFRDQLKELVYFGRAAVKAVRNGELAFANNKATPDAYRAAAILAADLLTADLSVMEWRQIIIELDAEETKAAYVSMAEYPARIKVSLAPFVYTGALDLSDSNGRFEAAAVLLLICDAVAKMWAGMSDEPESGAYDGEDMFWEALTGYATDQEGLEFARVLRMSGPDSLTFNRWVDDHYFGGSGQFLDDRIEGMTPAEIENAATNVAAQRARAKLTVVANEEMEH